jgi:hypothetical protein
MGVRTDTCACASKHRHKHKRYIMLALHKDDAKPALPENDTSSFSPC